MLNPKSEFEIDKKKFGSKLNFSYKWIIRTENRIAQTNIVTKYKNKLGSYLKLYEDASNASDYYVKIYPIYKKLSKHMDDLLNVNFRKKTSLEHKYISDGENFILPANIYLYKGTKYFYDETTEVKIGSKVPFIYLGDKYIGYYYAKRYSGGLQVYKSTTNIKLFNVTNDSNMYKILDQIKSKNMSETFFDKITYGEFYKAIKTKYGVGVNKYFQAWNISKYTHYSDMWLYEPEKSINYVNFYDNSYTGWYFGAGNIDRVCAQGLMLLLKNNFDGLTGITGFYTPFSSATATEIIIWNPNVIQREIQHKYDTMQFIKNLNFNPLEIKFDRKLSTLNANLRLLEFYTNHKILKHEIEQINQFIQTFENHFRVMSLNVHNFKSINLNDNSLMIMNQLIDLMNDLNIDIGCFQDVGIEHIDNFNNLIQTKINVNSYIMISQSINGLIIIHKNNLIVSSVSIIHDFAIGFVINDKFFINTQLNSGKKLYDRSGSLLNADEVVKIINFNYNLRKKQIDQLIKINPNYIIGNFNFTNIDPEYNYIINQIYKSNHAIKYQTINLNYTTAFNTQTDYVFSISKIKFCQTIKWPYSLHLPIICCI